MLGKQKAEHTRRNIGQTLRKFCEFVNKDPEELIKLDSKEASKLIQDFIDRMADRKLSIRYINVTLSYLKTK